MNFAITACVPIFLFLAAWTQARASAPSSEHDESTHGPKVSRLSCIDDLLKSEPAPLMDDFLKRFKETGCQSEDETLAAITAAAKSPASLSFVHLGWSVESLLKQRDFVKFARAYRKAHPKSKLSFHFIDASPLTTDYGALYALPDWDRKKLTIGGWGELLWMKKGRVLDYTAMRKFESADKIIKRTNVLIPPASKIEKGKQ